MPSEEEFGLKAQEPPDPPSAPGETKAQEPRGGGRAASFLRRRSVVVGLVALIAAVALIVVATQHGSSSDSGSSRAGGATNPPKATITVDQGKVAAGSPGGRSWRAVKGQWLIRSGTLSVKTPGQFLFSMLVTNGGSANVLVQAKMSKVVSGIGLVFRLKDPFNYWVVRAEAGTASWRVAKVVASKGTVVGNTGPSPTAPGTVVAVTTRSDGAIAISFDGKTAGSFSDPDLVENTVVGVQAVGAPANKARFIDVNVSSTLGP